MTLEEAQWFVNDHALSVKVKVFGRKQRSRICAEYFPLLRAIYVCPELFMKDPDQNWKRATLLHEIGHASTNDYSNMITSEFVAHKWALLRARECKLKDVEDSLIEVAKNWVTDTKIYKSKCYNTAAKKILCWYNNNLLI